MFTASDVGWVVGHSYIVYAPLLTGATTVLYEGKPIGTPDAGAFWRVIEEYRAVCLFTAPTAFRAIKKEDSTRVRSSRTTTSPHFRALFLAGERLDPDTYEWASAALGKPVIDNWWQTETGWPIAANPKGIGLLPIKAGLAHGGGARLRRAGARRHRASRCEPGVEGAICIKLPMPPGTLPTLWGDDDRYVSSYLAAYPGYYLTGDGGYVDEDGYLYVMGRTDDVLNVAGHRLSTGCARGRAGRARGGGGVRRHRRARRAQGPGAARARRAQVGHRRGEPRESGSRASSSHGCARRSAPWRRCTRSTSWPGLPKTRSGKILRKTMREIADGKTPTVPATIEDPAVLEALGAVLRGS